MISTCIYVHASKEAMLELGQNVIGLKGEALEMFKWTAHEVRLDIEVDETTGKSKIVKVDGRTVMP